MEKCHYKYTWQVRKVHQYNVNANICNGNKFNFQFPHYVALSKMAKRAVKYMRYVWTDEETTMLIDFVQYSDINNNTGWKATN